ncbi:6-hydroxymethylpterin diphosphokinase MptE-like protein [Aliarcobacter butzleri]|uniref:6-hydroxymethylpterin diphosphokinase MptE-like protein n=1 Tax=Aliarcobacter butzleri TaxID=28197 RepID=UPI002B24543B|nr:6-hydroxymethylpterin diphosphokinase MptE-like protein [Aliarcobacter butzleri]
MTEAQIQLQNALTTTFLANLVFLSEYDRNLYHRVDELSRMIENGTYQEKYALEFLMENGEFDIYDIVNDKYLYNKNPKKMNDELVRKVQFDEKNSILNLSSHFLVKEKIEVNKDKRFDFEKQSEFLHLTISDIQEYTNATKEYLDNKKRNLKKIAKFIFIGTLLGRHIPRIAEKVDANSYLILEKNLEIFRLSLFTVDYTILAKKGAIFSIMDDELSQDRAIYDFLSIEDIENYLIKFSTTNININSYIDSILTNLRTLDPMSYDYNRRLYSHLNRTTKLLKSKFKTILFNKLKKNCKFFRDKPILYIAAGPSLDENIEWIKQNQNKFFIVTIGAAYKKLLLNNIHIDMISTLDEKEELNSLQFDDESVNKLSNNTIILASTITYYKILEKLYTKNLYLFEVFSSLHKNNISFSGFSIGEVTLNILFYLNPKSIYIIGLDLSLNQVTGESHSENANSTATKLNLEDKQTRDTFEAQKSLIKIKGNLKKEVFTTPFFYSSIQHINNQTILHKNKSTKIYNLSSNGAFFKDTITKKVSNIKINDFKDLSVDFSKLLEILDTNSENKLFEESKKELNKGLKILKNSLKKDLDKIKSTEFTSYDDFLEEIIKIISQSNKIPHFFQLFVFYNESIIPYISYYFNNKKMKNEIKILKKVKNIYIKQIENLIDDYEICLKRVI